MFGRVSVLAVAVLTLVYNVHAQACDRTYTVQSGDTCDLISANENVSTFQLAHVNPQIDAACDNLQVGEDLCLGDAGQDCTINHVVQSGDFCQLIADEANISLSLLLANNPNVNGDCTNLGIGEVLCTANVTIPYTNITTSA